MSLEGAAEATIDKINYVSDGDACFWLQPALKHPHFDVFALKELTITTQLHCHSLFSVVRKIIFNRCESVGEELDGRLILIIGHGHRSPLIACE